MEINVANLVDKFCKTYGIYPNSILVEVYKQGIYDILNEAKKLMENDNEAFEEIKES